LERRKLASVLFCDMSGSTAMGERVDAESVRDLMFRYFHEMRSAIERHGGTVEKFIGDAVMAVFGVPVAHEDDALRAARAATEMRLRLASLNDELERRFGTRIALRIGIETGEVVAGDSTNRQAIVTGDTVNVAARLEQAASPGEILLGERTFRLVRDAVVAEPIEPLSLKGKAESVTAYRLLAVGDEPRAYASRFEASLVGRAAELDTLRSEFVEAVATQSCRRVTIIGQPGVGKSRLTAEFVDLVGGEAAVLSGRCLSYGEGITYWPLGEIVRQAAAVHDEDSPEVARTKVDALVAGDPNSAVIAKRVAQAIGLLGGAAPAEEIAWAAGRLVEAVARRRPLVVLLDDLHWAEAAFLDLVDHLVASSRDAPLLVLGLARPELLEHRADPGPIVQLDSLDDANTARLIEELLGVTDLSGDVGDRIVEAAGGNPLFVEELLAMLIDDGVLRRENDTWVRTSDLSDVAIPLTIEALLGARLDRLDDGVRMTIERASVEGQVFHRESVLALSDEQLRPRVPAHLERLAELEFIRPAQAAFAGDAAYRFRHILIRDAAYSGTTKKLRAELHERLADRLAQATEARAGEFEEILGHHLEQAYRYREELGPLDEHAWELGARAAARLAAAGRRAHGRGDMPAAVNLLGRAAALFAADDPRRLEILPDLGVALMRGVDFAQAEAVLSEACEGARAVDDPLLYARALVDLTLVRLQLETERGTEDEIVRVTALTIPVFEAASEHSSLAKAWKLLAQRDLHLLLRYGAALERLERALDHATRAGDAGEQAEIRFWMAFSIAFGPTPAEEGIARLDELFAEATGPYEQAHRLAFLASGNALRGRFDEARSQGAEAAQIYRDLGLRLLVAGMANNWGPIELRAGDPVAAERTLREGYDGLEQMGEKGYLSSVAGHLARALYEQGRDDEAARYATICCDTSAPDDLMSQMLWRSVRAKLLARRGEHEEAEILARDAVRLAEATDAIETHADTLFDLAEVLELAGRPDAAVLSANEALRLYEQKGVVPSIRRVRSFLASNAAARS
jgi:class 3 adenylate cyclase/tetratricopeptide (TPR) repeat protein